MFLAAASAKRRWNGAVSVQGQISHFLINWIYLQTFLQHQSTLSLPIPFTYFIIIHLSIFHINHSYMYEKLH